MPGRDIYDLRHWRSRAKEMRGLAEGMNDTKTRRIVTRLADGWDKMADRAERRAANVARYLDRNGADLLPSRLLHESVSPTATRRGGSPSHRQAAGPAARNKAGAIISRP